MVVRMFVCRFAIAVNRLDLGGLHLFAAPELAGRVPELMNLARLRTHAHQRFSWLLALVLLLPLAQSVAALHAFSHARTAEAETAAVTHGVGQNVCDVCLAALAVTGGVPPLRSFSYLKITDPDTAPRVECIHAFCRFATPAYESRAPPFAPI